MNALMNLCVIPARGGSKRIPRKNILPFRGKPMIAWSIQAAQKSGCFDKIIVSTDDQEIACVSRLLGAEVPFIRPCDLADDHTGTCEVVEHAVAELQLMGQPSSYVCCLYATAPFVRSVDIRQGFELLNRSREGTVVFTATSFAFPIQRAVSLDVGGYSSAFDPVSAAKRSQDLEEYFHDAGQFYWATASTWRHATNIFDSGRPLILPRWRVQDIDTIEDWRRAELMHSVIENELIDV